MSVPSERLVDSKTPHCRTELHDGGWTSMQVLAEALCRTGQLLRVRTVEHRLDPEAVGQFSVVVTLRLNTERSRDHVSTYLASHCLIENQRPAVSMSDQCDDCADAALHIRGKGLFAHRREGQIVREPYGRSWDAGKDVRHRDACAVQPKR